ncbi:MAG: hypothetical protein QNJ56_08970 [Gammaproteobacteria bacterium]|nr:hypothetical protein [Gammaproteobacteria bacterium]
MRIIILFFSYWLAASPLLAQERIEMKGTSIIGNKELPKVLYIVPWKAAEDIDLKTPPFSSVLDEVLNPLERPAFQRQVQYYHDLYPNISKNSEK